MNEVNDFGLSSRDKQTIISLLDKYGITKNVVVFGSRSKGNFHNGSDIDLAIIDKSLEIKRLRELKESFEESLLPYNVDIVDVSQLSSESLKEHIFRVGKPIV